LFFLQKIFAQAVDPIPAGKQITSFPLLQTGREKFSFIFKIQIYFFPKQPAGPAITHFMLCG
jgi:hypothetical protein